MNILLLCDEYPPCKHGGIGTVTQMLAHEFIKKKHDVVVCGFYPWFRKAPKCENDHGVVVYRYYYGNRILLKLSRHRILGKIFNVRSVFNSYILKVRAIIRRHNIDILEIPDYNEIFRYSGPKSVAFPDFNIPMVVKIHGGDTFFSYIKSDRIKHDLLYEKEKKLIDNADSLIAISEYSKTVVREIFNYDKTIPVIYNGISISNTLEYNADPDNPVVVFAGSIKYKKGIFSLIKAWGKVISVIPKANLYIYGSGSKKTIKDLLSIIDRNINHSVHLMGFIEKEQLMEIYSRAACSVFPSFAESFGMAPIEAMLAACPTIFTTRTSGPELITHGQEGLLVDPEAINSISEAIIYLIRNYKEAQNMGRNGAKKVISKFSIASIAEQHLNLYNSIIQIRKNLE